MVFRHHTGNSSVAFKRYIKCKLEYSISSMDGHRHRYRPSSEKAVNVSYDCGYIYFSFDSLFMLKT